MQKTWSLDVNNTKDREWLDKKWKEEFKKKAELVIGSKYDYEKIKHHKSLLTIWDNEVNLEVSKVLVHVTAKIGGKDHENCRKHVDAMALNLGIPY